MALDVEFACYLRRIQINKIPKIGEKPPKGADRARQKTGEGLSKKASAAKPESPRFTPRKKELNEIPAKPDAERAAVLYGFAGIGKSELTFAIRREYRGRKGKRADADDFLYRSLVPAGTENKTKKQIAGQRPQKRGETPLIPDDRAGKEKVLSRLFPKGGSRYRLPVTMEGG